MRFRFRSAFTLIELLIVVAIIAILAAIAVPNMLEAQTRAKVSRVRSEMRSLATALEAYRTDNNQYIPDIWAIGSASYWNHGIIWRMLSTPVAYVTAIPNDVFIARRAIDWMGTGERTLEGAKKPYLYYTTRGWGHTTHLGDAADGFFVGQWIMTSPGPDLAHNYSEWAFGSEPTGTGLRGLYDPTNGSTSFGDIVRWGP